jgi:hypothetical protein
MYRSRSLVIVASLQASSSSEGLPNHNFEDCHMFSGAQLENMCFSRWNL